MKSIAIIQTSFLPWLGYYEQMALVDVFVHFDDVQYTRKDWRNRNRLKGPDGIKTVTVPVQKHLYAHTPINQIRIANSQPWRDKLLQQIRFWYEKAEYFGEHFPAIERIFLKRCDFLVDLNHALNDWARDTLQIATPQFMSSAIREKPDDRNLKIIEICRHHGANLLYDGQSARNFIDLELFRSRGIQVVFQEYRHRPYPQLWGPFESHLSLLDLVFNCGPGSKRILLSNTIPLAARIS